ncbi:hypothetical protein MS3_00004532 [Schistosoma haematobium]|uniref:Uncharacterized protein n=1 Tax=Schistosoma haematobium TaxID=6185 RepID=A0A922LSX1_SCHHA|nr:hypothetical protein MS3_00004532 [Schistosoma haematobium]KAH9592696.1 hypothetical protein MS3_00004532 [Schistosoma haematobium]
MDKYVTENQINGKYNQNKEVDNDRLKNNNNQSKSRSTGQIVSHMCRNSNTSLLPEVCANDIIQKNNECSTTKPSSSQIKTPPSLFEMYCANILHNSDNLHLLITISKFIKGTDCFK